MGGGSSSSSKELDWGIKNGTSTSAPWAVQAPFISDIFNKAQKQYDTNMAQGAWGGDYVAPSTQQQRDQGNAVFSGADANQSQNDAMLQSSQDVMGAGQNWMGDAAGTMSNLSGDQTGTIIDNANKYRAGFDLDGAVKSAMAAANRNAAENSIPSLYRNAAAGGGLNSSRAALAQGVVERGLAEASLNTRANLDNANYQFGVGQAGSDLNRRLQSASSLGSLGSNAYNMGQAGINAGINNQGKIDTRRMAAADYLQALNQNDLNNSLMKFSNGQNFGWGQLANLYNIIGNKSWGSTNAYNETSLGGKESQTQQNPSTMSTVGSMLGAAGSLVGTGGGGGLIGGFRSLFS